jgi:septum formation protein
MATVPVWLADRPLLLASTSTTRRLLVAAAGLPVETEAAGIDERAIEEQMGEGATPLVIAGRLASLKAASAASRNPGRIVVGADQVLDLDGRTMAKPVDRPEAARQLAQLSGRTHILHSAVSIRVPGRPEMAFVEQARLTMRNLDEAVVASYLAHAGEAVFRSVGGYQIEGIGIHLFERIEGEHTTILGLPMLRLLAVLRALDLIGI